MVRRKNENKNSGINNLINDFCNRVQNQTTNNNVKKEDFKNRNLSNGQYHNVILDTIYNKIYNDHHENKVTLSENEIKPYFNDIISSVLIGEGLINTSADFTQMLAYPASIANPSDPIETSVASYKIEISSLHAKGLIFSNEHEILTLILDALTIDDYNQAYTKLLNIRADMEQQGVYGEFFIATNTLDVAINSAEYWKVNFENWNTLISSMCGKSNNTRLAISATVFACDAIGAIGGAIDHIVEGEQNPAGAVFRVVGSAVSFSTVKPVAIITTVIGWFVT